MYTGSCTCWELPSAICSSPERRPTALEIVIANLLVEENKVGRRGKELPRRWCGVGTMTLAIQFPSELQLSAGSPEQCGTEGGQEPVPCSRG